MLDESSSKALTSRSLQRSCRANARSGSLCCISPCFRIKSTDCTDTGVCMLHYMAGNTNFEESRTLGFNCTSIKIARCVIRIPKKLVSHKNASSSNDSYDEDILTTAKIYIKFQVEVQIDAYGSILCSSRSSAAKHSKIITHVLGIIYLS